MLKWFVWRLEELNHIFILLICFWIIVHYYFFLLIAVFHREPPIPEFLYPPHPDFQMFSRILQHSKLYFVLLFLHSLANSYLRRFVSLFLFVLSILEVNIKPSQNFRSPIAMQTKLFFFGQFHFQESKWILYTFIFHKMVSTLNNSLAWTYECCTASWNIKFLFKFEVEYCYRVCI